MTSKPPTQVAGVVGIDSVPIAYTPPQEKQAAPDWKRLIRLPAFQMFAAESAPEIQGQGTSHAAQFVQAMGAGADLYDAYCQWHKAKGKWPNETPMGELIGG